MVLLDDEDKKELENTTGWLLHFLAFGYFLTGDFIAALDSIDKVIKLDIDEESESSEHYTTSAKINLKLNNKEKAIEDLKKALGLDPNYEEAIQLLASLK
jgi:tetratricopeptide (TPR) repeat protein